MIIVDNTELGRRITYKVGNQEKEGTVLSILSTEAPYYWPKICYFER